jgi:hypothetical protein
MKPTCSARQRASSAFATCAAMSMPSISRFAAVGRVDAGDQIEQRRLAGTGRPHQRHELAAPDVEVDVFQHRHALIAAP